MSQDHRMPAHDRDSSEDLTWDGTFPDQDPSERTATSGQRTWLHSVGVLVAIAAVAGAGFIGGLAFRNPAAPDRPGVAEPGTPTGFDTRRPGRDADGTETQFINIRYYTFDIKATAAGFDGRCVQDLFLFVVGRFTPCNWAVSVVDQLRGYDENTYLGYEPSFVLDGVDVYCHYQNPGLIFRDDVRTKGIPAWECRADGGRQLIFTGLTMSNAAPQECWAPDGTLRADMSIYAGSPAAKEFPLTKPEWSTPIPDCVS